MKKSILFLFGIVLLTPWIALADAFQNAIQPVLTNIVEPLVLLVFSAALVYFLWGVVIYIKNLDNPKEKETGQRHILYGIIGMAIMISVFGIMKFIYTSVVTDTTKGSGMTVGGTTFQTNPPAALNGI